VVGAGELVQASLVLDLGVDAQPVPFPEPVRSVELESIKLLVVQAAKAAEEVLGTARLSIMVLLERS
jgi:hypothetical protein